MTDVLRLPSRLDSTTVDVDDLVHRIKKGNLLVDWDDVESVDHEALKELLAPFSESDGEFDDALGVMTMPDSIALDVDYVLGKGPRPEIPETSTWLILQAERSIYDDQDGRHYEYPTHIPNGRQLAVGDTVVCCNSSKDASEGRRVFGIATVGEIVEADNGRLHARYHNYRRIEPAFTFEQLGGDPRKNVNNSINRITAAFAERVGEQLEQREGRARYARGGLPEMDLSSGEGVRDALHDLITLDLLGPALGADEELVSDAPRSRYVVGTLAPRGAQIDPAALDDPLEGAGGVREVGENEGAPDGALPASTTLFNSSIGYTFVVAGGVDEIEIVASWGKYERRASELHFTKTGEPRKVWRRNPKGDTLRLSLTTGISDSVPDPSEPDVVVKTIVRPPSDDGSRTVSVFLVNTRMGLATTTDDAWVFQPELIARSTVDQEAVFVRRDIADDSGSIGGDAEAEERALLAMSHRKQAEFAIGHGVGVHAKSAGDPWVDETGWERATEIRTSVLPSYDVPATGMPDNEQLREHFPGCEGFELDMQTLATLDSEPLISSLREIPNTYQRWIEQQRERLETDSSLAAHRAAAEEALENAERARERLTEGVDVLEQDPDALRAFRFANEAMRMQRLRSIYAAKRRKNPDLTFEEVEKDPEVISAWRAFQLAFILLNVATVTRPDHPHRNQSVGAYADLLWFPTGGGKTEAYLGVAAFSIGIRRLQGTLSGFEGDGGATVIMRYTLRLLTLQQFQRAATLVCAMEQIRQSDNGSTWGHEPFRIGLWVGGSSTPNSTYESGKWVNENKGEHEWDNNGGAANPLQLTNCPWCGSKLNANNVTVEHYKSGRGRTFLHCRDRKCSFTKRNNAEGIPVVTVDEEIYRVMPTFLLATVDKFAQMPWRGEVQSLFGRVSRRCERHGWLGTEAECSGEHKKRGSLPACSPIAAPENGFRPPDLIIQDELHLISGPLGTLVGLYETAVDELSTWEHNGATVRPKVVASTATTRRAAEQVHQLFCREVKVFPPIGLDADDNFFSQQIPLEKQAGRRYVGVCAPGRSRTAVLIRIYVATLTAAQFLWNETPEELRADLVDPYMTLLGYFNSLRELGGMRRLVDDDVSTRAYRIERDDRPGLTQRDMNPDSTQELTSRIRSSKIPDLLDQLDVAFPRPTEKGPDGKWAQFPLDVVLATNMVSVGVDVERMGLMVVSGQPKTTAEYIQASSRVGRTKGKPGLVITSLNWARPRDLSHYEQFEHYHAVFYRYVEALSVTPFAQRALNRGLTGVLASMIRLDSDEFNHNHGAGEIKGAGQFSDLTDQLADRAQNATNLDEDHVAVGARVRQALSARLDEWAAEASTPNRKLGYRPPRTKDDVTVGLLKPPGKEPWESFTTPTSMREVEPGVGLVLGAERKDQTPAWRFDSPSDKEQS